VCVQYGATNIVCVLYSVQYSATNIVCVCVEYSATNIVCVCTVQCYQHSVCNNCILSLQLRTCLISEAVHSGRDRLLGIVVSEELTATVFSVTVCGKAVHLFPLAEYRAFLLADDMSFVTSPACGRWGVSTTLI
jgi:hypothetical protein